MYIHAHIYIHVYIYIIYMYIYIYVCIYICTCICTHIHIYIIQADVKLAQLIHVDLRSQIYMDFHYINPQEIEISNL